MPVFLVYRFFFAFFFFFAIIITEKINQNFFIKLSFFWSKKSLCARPVFLEKIEENCRKNHLQQQQLLRVTFFFFFTVFFFFATIITEKINQR